MPVGPDTSRIIAEVIASAIDQKIQHKLKINERHASRYVDDYTIGVSSEQTGESVIAAVRQSVGQFQLELNNDKSAIISSGARLPIGWKQTIASCTPVSNSSYSEFQKFFYEVSRICENLPDKNIEKFAFSNAKRAFSTSTQWRKIQSNLIHSYRRNPSLVSFLTEILILRDKEQEDVDKEPLIEFLGAKIPSLAEENRTGEIIWLLFLCARLKLKLKSSSLESLFAVENGMVALLIAYLNSEDLIEGNVDFKVWNQFLDAEGLRGPMWLYAYEGSIAGLIPKCNTNFIEKDHFFSLLLSKRISFFSIENGFESLRDRLFQRMRENVRKKILRDDFFDDFDIGIDELDGTDSNEMPSDEDY